MFRPLNRFIEGQQWLDSLGESLQPKMNGLFAGKAGKQIKNTLNGTWLGHPIHPAITDVPVGAWVCTSILDALGSAGNDTSLQRAADVTLITGLASAVGAASTGWTDWSDTYGKDRKLGLLHGMTMGTVVVIYVASLVARLTGSRGTGTKLATAGLLLASAGAYLGGDEVYDLGYGINHTAFEQPPSSYTAVMAEAELPPNTPTKGQANDVSVMLVKQDNQIYALGDTCVHAGCSLSSGRIDGHSIICPCHGSQFDLRDGSVINGPATMPEPAYDVRIQNGVIEVKQA